MSTDGRNGRLLIVDDSPDTRELLQRNLSSRGYQVLTAASAPEALGLLASAHVDLVITDLKMPGTSGIELVRQVKEKLADTQVIVITGYPSVEGAVTAVKAGAEEFLTKPFTQDELLAAVDRVMRKAGPTRHDFPSDHSLPNPLGIVAESAAMRAALEAAARAAVGLTPVLITGERGTGREMIARSIHFAGRRARAPFISVDCGAIPSEYLGWQLFGSALDVSSNAAASSAGLIHLARGGTLFLRDVAVLPPRSQAALLHVLEGITFRASASTQDQPGTARLIAASDGGLPAPIGKATSGEDLLDQLGRSPIVVPPLRERRDDVPVLARRFLARFAGALGTDVPKLSAEALEIVTTYAWPGNVAELQNCMRQLALAAAGATIAVSDLPGPMRCRGHEPAGTDRSLAELEADHIRSVLAIAKGNKTRAAEILGINRKTLRQKLRHAGEAPARR